MNDSDVLLESCRFYIEGVALLPISIVGIIGKTFYMSGTKNISVIRERIQIKLNFIVID